MPLAPARQGVSDGFHIYPIVMEEGTLGNPETIVWASIRHLCSREVAEGIAAPLHGITTKKDKRAIGRNLKLYIRHASEFYEAAGAAKANTAPLIYYYSFLNLAKALCELRSPEFHKRSECYKHGVSWRPDPQRVADPAKETVSITTRGVWHVLWEALTQKPCPATNPTKLGIKKLFSYCPEVSVESDQTLGTALRMLDVEAPDVLWDTGSREVWLRLSFGRSELKAFRVSAPALIKQIRTPRSGYTEVKSKDRRFRTFQSASPKKLARGELPRFGIASDIAALNLFTHLGPDRTLEYYLPLQARLPFPLPQLMINYTILFWLGSLVRYDPHSVDRLMDSGYWMLIDGFMSQSRLWLLELFEWAFYRAETTLLISR